MNKNVSRVFWEFVDLVQEVNRIYTLFSIHYSLPLKAKLDAELDSAIGHCLAAEAEPSQ